MKLEPEQRQRLLEIARESIAFGLAFGREPVRQDEEFQGALAEPGASFVTLKKHGELRGCRGVIEAIRPLALDVCHNAYMTAFDDPRFPPLTAPEFPEVSITISVLTPLERLVVASEVELLEHLEPGRDGLVLADGFERATFLPSVWETLPQPEQFLAHLKWKAGWPADYWSDSLKVFRYRTESFE